MSTLPSRDRPASLIPAVLLPLWAVVALLPFGRSAELGVLLALAGCGLLLWREPARRTGLWPQWRLFVLLWACYAGAALISALDAVRPDKSWGTVLAALRFLPLGLYAALVLPDIARHAQLRRGIAVVVAVWLADAWIQALTGWSLGGAPEAERLSGLFGQDNLKLGPVLATLSPFLLQAARERWGRRGLLLAFVALLGPVLLAGSRASWLALAVVAAVFLWRETRRPLLFLGGAGLLALAATAAVAVAWQTSDAFDARMDRTLLALQGSRGDVDFALAGRAQIWRASAAMIAAHPFNGVGVRGFRHAYAAYAQPGDTFVQPDGSGAAHAHQWLLEVLSETGVLGLLLWLVGIALALRAWSRAGPAARAAAFAPGLALLAMGFPLNTHLAFYSAWWGLLFWWLIAQYCAALAVAEEPAHA
jgi:O-antigen ligase